MIFRTLRGPAFISRGTAGCLLEKAFQSTQVDRDDGALYVDAVKVLRSSYPPVTSSFENTTTLQIPVSRDHFDGPCNEHKRRSCPLQLGQRALVAQKRKAGFILYDEVVKGYTAWIVEHVIDGVAIFASEMMKAAELVGKGRGWHFLDDNLENIRWMETDTIATQHGMISLIEGVKKMLAGQKMASAGFVLRWNELIRASTSLVHDMNTFTTTRAVYLHELFVNINKRDVENVVEILSELRQTNTESLAKLVQMAVSLNKKLTIEARVKIEIGLLPELHVARAARFPLIRILSEFLANAIKYRDQTKEECYIKIYVSHRGEGWLNVHVMDNGVGIEDTHAVQELGFREKPKLAPGDGIGLASVRSIAKQQGWKFNIHSEVGRGTSMTLGVKMSGHENLVPGSTPGSFNDKIELHRTPSTIPPYDRVITIPPPPGLPHDLMGSSINDVSDSSVASVSNLNTSLVGASYLLLSIPVLPRTQCG